MSLNIATLIFVLFLFGVVFIAVECFIPGVGIFGISGAVMVIVSLVLTNIFIDNSTFYIIIELVIAAVTIGLFMLIARLTGFNDKLVNDEALKSEDVDKLLRESVGKAGKALTPLKPVGKVEIDGKVLECESDGEFIKKGDVVKAEYVKDGRLYVGIGE